MTAELVVKLAEATAAMAAQDDRRGSTGLTRTPGRPDALTP